MESHKGQLLVATESLRDPNFARTVILLFEHTENGAGGIILNRPGDKMVRDIAEPLFGERSDWSKLLHVGGPVPGPLAIAHTDEDQADMEVFEGLFGAVATPNVLELIRRKEEPSLVVVQYSGWGPGQLEAELTEDAWQLWPARLDHVFWGIQRDLWTAVTAEINGAALAKRVGMKSRPVDPLAN